MSTSNAKLGLKRAGKRSMMKLPDDRTLRTQLSSARCPSCGQRGARLRPGSTPLQFFCSWCSHVWAPADPAEDA